MHSLVVVGAMASLTFTGVACQSDQASSSAPVEDVFDGGGADEDAPSQPDTPPAADAGGGAAPGDASADVGVDVEAVWAELRQAIDDSDIDEVVVLMGDASGVLFSHAKGDTDADKVYPLASASKWWTSLTALKMVEAGDLALTDHPQAHLPWWTDDPEDPRSAVTLEQLLSFTSGFEGDSGLDPRRPGISCVGDSEVTLEGCAQAIYSDPELFLHSPGSAFYYGPAHMHIAGAMMEASAETPWPALFRRHVGDPLGLSPRSRFAFPSTQNARPAGGGAGTASDYALVMTALARGDFISDETLEAMSVDRTPEGVEPVYVPATASEGRSWHYALGCWRECEGEAYTEACDEPGVISSPGAFGFYPWFDMSQKTWGVIGARLPSAGTATTVPLGQAWFAIAREALVAR